MRYLYIFPHPDDESFGPARAIAQQRRLGAEVHLLTLTKGEATKVRKQLGVSKDEMGEIRYREMLAVSQVLDLTSMEVLDFPDGELAQLDPRLLEQAVARHCVKIKPDVIVTYPVHGISGFHDHLVTHAAVKRAFLELRETEPNPPRRLAFFTVSAEDVKTANSIHSLNASKEERIACRLIPSPEDSEKMERALDCYETYRTTIEQSGVRKTAYLPASFELFGEPNVGPLSDLSDSLPEK